MRRACGAPAPHPGKGLRPLTLFRNDAEQGMPIASARCAMRTRKVCSFQSIFARRIAQHAQNILYAQDNPTHVRFPVCGMQTKRLPRENAFSLRSAFFVLPGFSLKIRLAAFAAPHTGLCILFHEFRLLQIQFTAVYGVTAAHCLPYYTILSATGCRVTEPKRRLWRIKRGGGIIRKGALRTAESKATIEDAEQNPCPPEASGRSFAGRETIPKGALRMARS